MAVVFRGGLLTGGETESNAKSAERRLHIVLIHRYFWPDTPPYAQILKEIALRLGEAGHRVTVLTCQPSYRPDVVEEAPRSETLGPGVEVRRWPVLSDRTSTIKKTANMVLFCGHLLAARRRLGRVDAVMAATTPPLAVARIGAWLARYSGGRFVYHKQDIYPEVVMAAGLFRRRRLAQFLRWIDARTEKRAERVVVLSEDMAETVRKRGTRGDQIEIINNFDPWPGDDLDTGSRQRVSDTDDPGPQLVKVVFAGNLGRFQNLETLIAAAVELREDPRIEFHFYGDGVMREHIEDVVRLHGLRNVRLHGYRPPVEIAQMLRDEADLGIVSLVPGVIRAAYPSKTMSYLRQGCPILALVEDDSELARSLKGSGAGFQVDPGDPASVADELRRLSDDKPALEAARRSAARLYRESFTKDRQLDRWVAMFERVGGAP